MNHQNATQYTCSICNGEGYIPVSDEKADDLNLTMYAQIYYKGNDESQAFVRCNRCCGSGTARSPH